MLGPVSYVDLVIFGVPLVVGLIVLWRGVGRSLLSMPVRLVVSLVLGWLAGAAVVVYFEVNQASLLDWTGGRLGLSRLGVLAGLRWLVAFVVVVALMLVSGRVRAYLVSGDANVTVGVGERVARFAVGAVVGLVLALVVEVPNYMLNEAFAPDPGRVTDVFGRPLSLPLIKHISDSTKAMFEGIVPEHLGPR
jgi:hypothetical protein